MDPTEDESGLDLTEDPHCHIHFVASDLPEPLPKLDLIERKFSALGNNHIQAFQTSKTSKYMLKRGRGVLMEGWTMLYLRKMTRIPIPIVYAILTNKKTEREIIIMEYIPCSSLDKIWSTLEVVEKEDVAKHSLLTSPNCVRFRLPAFSGAHCPPSLETWAKSLCQTFYLHHMGQMRASAGPLTL